MQIKKIYIWLCVLLQPIFAYGIVSLLSMQHTGGAFNPKAAFYYYGIAFTCSTGILLFGELVLILGSLGLFRLALLLFPNGLFFISANICLAAGLIGPAYMVSTGTIPYCWGK
jgi:hypothetical protein